MNHTHSPPPFTAAARADLRCVCVCGADHVVKRNQVLHTMTERSVLGHITHPFIVALRYAFQTPQKLYFVLDYCPGGGEWWRSGRGSCL